MNEEVNHFSKLDLDELKSRAIGWMKRFPSIQEISLYRAAKDDSGQEDEDQEFEDQEFEPTDWNLEYVLVAKVSDLPAVEKDKALLNYYKRFVDGRFRFASPLSGFRLRDIEKFFHQKENANLEDWFWVTVPPGDEGFKYLRGLRLVQSETRLLLNSRDSEEQSVIDHKPLTVDRFENKSVDYSKKTKSELKFLIESWIKEGQTRREIAMTIWPNEYTKKNADNLMKRVDRRRK